MVKIFKENIEKMDCQVGNGHETKKQENI